MAPSARSLQSIRGKQNVHTKGWLNYQMLYPESQMMVWMSALHGGWWIETQLCTAVVGEFLMTKQAALVATKDILVSLVEFWACWLPNVTGSHLIIQVMTFLNRFQSAFSLHYPLQSLQSTRGWARMGCWSSATKKREDTLSEMRIEPSTVRNGTYPSPGRWES